jgi:hypothetical protein
MAITRMQTRRQLYGLGSFVKKLTKPVAKLAGKLVPKEIAGPLRAIAPFLPPGYREAAYLAGTAKQTGRISPLDLALVTIPNIRTEAGSFKPTGFGPVGTGTTLGAQASQYASEAFRGLTDYIPESIKTPVTEFFKGTETNIPESMTAAEADTYIKNAANLEKISKGAGSKYLDSVGITIGKDAAAKSVAKQLALPVGLSAYSYLTAEEPEDEDEKARQSAAQYDAEVQDYLSKYRNMMVKDGGRIKANRGGRIMDKINKRMGYGLGSMVRSSGVAVPVSNEMNSGQMASSGMNSVFGGSGGIGGMLSNYISNNPDMFRQVSSAGPSQMMPMTVQRSSDFIDENQDGIDDRMQMVKNGGRIGYKDAGYVGEREDSLKGGGYDSTLSFNPLEDDINSLLEGGGASAGIVSAMLRRNSGAMTAAGETAKKGLNKSTIELTKKESKYLKELINDTGGGKFKAEILEEVPSLLVKNNKLTVKQRDLDSFSKYLDDVYISELKPSGRGANLMPPRLRSSATSDKSVLGKLFRENKTNGGRIGFAEGELVYPTDENSAVQYLDENNNPMTLDDFLKRSLEEEQRTSGMVPVTNPAELMEETKMRQEEEDRLMLEKIRSGLEIQKLMKKEAEKAKKIKKAGGGIIDIETEMDLDNSYAEVEGMPRGIKYKFTEINNLGNSGRAMANMGGVMIPPVRRAYGGVMELDARETGGFVPMGMKEKKDDVPAMLAKNEFVMTADSVRGIGNGDVNKGAKILQTVMKNAEKVGRRA